MKKIVLLSMFLLASNANGALIDFEAYSTGNLSNVQVIDGVEFSVTTPTPQTALRIFKDAARTAFILSCDFSTGFSCDQDMSVDFKQQVNNVSFDFLSEDNQTGEISGYVSAFLNGILVGTVNLISDGDVLSHNAVDLSGLGLIDRLVLSSSIDPAGLGYDNFRFTPAAVPVPAAIWLFGSSIIGLIAVRRKSI